MAFWKGYDPKEVARINKERPSAWTLFKEGLAEGAGKALVEAPIRFGTDIAVDYVSPTRRREREHMTTQENLAASEQAETTRFHGASENAAQEAARTAAQQAAARLEQREKASRRSSKSLLVAPEVEMPQPGPASEETPLPEIVPTIAPPPSLGAAQGLLDTIRSGRKTAEAREAAQGLTTSATVTPLRPRAAESTGYREMRRGGVAEPAKEPEYRFDEGTGVRSVRGRVSEAPDAPMEEIVLAGTPESEFDAMYRREQIASLQADTKLMEKKAAGGGNGGGMSGRDMKDREYWLRKQNAATQRGLDAEAAHADAMQRWIEAGRTGPKPDMKTYQPQRGESKGLILDVLSGMTGKPSGGPSAATTEYLGGDATLQAQRVKQAEARQQLAELKAERDADANAVREQRMNRSEALRREQNRVSAARGIDIFASQDLQALKNEVLRSVLTAPPPATKPNLDAIKAKLKHEEDLTPAETEALDSWSK